MPISSRRCGMITKREAERLCKSFLGDNSPPKLPENFAFEVFHECAWGSRGQFVPSRYNSSRAKCIKCHYCAVFFSPNKFVFHSHRTSDSDKYVQPDAANFNSWRRHTKLLGDPPEVRSSAFKIKGVVFSVNKNHSISQEIAYAWEDVKAMFNGGTRKRILSSAVSNSLTMSSPPKASPRSDHTETEKSDQPERKCRKPMANAEISHLPLVSGSSQNPFQHVLEKKNSMQTLSSCGLDSKPVLGSEAHPRSPFCQYFPRVNTDHDFSVPIRNDTTAPVPPPVTNEKLAFAAAMAAAGNASAGGSFGGLADYIWPHGLPQVHPQGTCSLSFANYPFLWPRKPFTSIFGKIFLSILPKQINSVVSLRKTSTRKIWEPIMP